MPIHSRTNQYRGVNAHLNSHLQGEFGGWGEFHQQHVSHLAEAIDAELPPGYVVAPERGLQIREFHPDTGERVQIQTRRPDLTIYERDPDAPRSGRPIAAATAPTLTLAASETIDDPELYRGAVVIRQVLRDGTFGDPVTWIEVLSPSNKPGGPGFYDYADKRLATLHGGIVLVEIDYLHETPPVIGSLPSYLKREPGAYPYFIAVTDPRPSLQKGYTHIYGFGVDEPLPVVPIPLAREDAIALDFGAVYHRTFSSLASFSLRADYEQEPDHIETYRADDQARIRARMAAVRQAVRQGLSLSAGPLPIET